MPGSTGKAKASAQARVRKLRLEAVSCFLRSCCVKLFKLSSQVASRRLCKLSCQARRCREAGFLKVVFFEAEVVEVLLFEGALFEAVFL